jgi:hypothetical protein
MPEITDHRETSYGLMILVGLQRVQNIYLGTDDQGQLKAIARRRRRNRQARASRQINHRH